MGTYLDTHGTEAFTLLEVPDGFTVVIEASDDRSVVHLGRQEIAGRMKEGKRSRASLEGIWRELGTTRSEFLEALGIELEKRQAYNLLIDRLDDGLVVSYSFLDPLRGYSWNKSVSVLRVPELREILERGRQEIRGGKRRWLF